MKFLKNEINYQVNCFKILILIEYFNKKLEKSREEIHYLFFDF